MARKIALNIFAGIFFCVFHATNPALAQEFSDYKVEYRGKDGPGKGKHIVFVASDHEYRSEESLPALARILAKHYGYTCTVLFGLDKDGYILPGSSNLRGLQVLDDADLLVIFARFLDLADEEMQYLDDYLRRGGPVVGFRTATHAFNNQDDPKWGHYSYNYDGPKKEWEKGFGKLVLGETWVDHYGTNHKQASRLLIEKGQEAHPIMRGVAGMFVQSGGYTVYPEETGATVLARGEILNGMEADAPRDNTKEELPVAWTRNYQLPSGTVGRAFTTTHGASEDLLNDGFRRMVVNACFWAMGMEDAIKPENNIDFVGPYEPTTFNFDGYKAGIRPADLAGWDSLIMPGEIVKPKE